MCLLSTRAHTDLLKEGVPVIVIGCIEFVLMGFAWGMLACKFAGKTMVLTYGRFAEPICQLWRPQKSSSCPVCAARRPKEVTVEESKDSEGWQEFILSLVC